MTSVSPVVKVWVVLHLAFFIVANSPEKPKKENDLLYCPNCAQEVPEPLTCGDCGSVICPRCGTPLESPDELGIG